MNLINIKNISYRSHTFSNGTQNKDEINSRDPRTFFLVKNLEEVPNIANES